MFLELLSPLSFGGNLVIGATLLAGGFGKLLWPGTAANLIGAQLRIKNSANIIIILSIAELVLGAIILFRPGYKVVYALVALLFFTFVAFLSHLWARGSRSISCGCFGGASRQPESVVTLLGKVICLFLLTILLLAYFSLSSSGADGFDLELSEKAAIAFTTFGMGLLIKLSQEFNAVRRLTEPKSVHSD